MTMQAIEEGTEQPLAEPLLATMQQERLAVEALPNLTHRIEKLGLSEEYLAFKERYLAWRKGEKSGARGEISVDHITRPEHLAANRGFAYWYPTMQEWMWKRTLSYWIAVTFFEGSIFFTISSFMFNQEDALGNYFSPMTLYGYCAGKVLFFLCCYFMCLQVINLHVCCGEGEETANAEEEEPFYWWPYRYQTALKNLERAGIGALPYCVASTYLTGVFAFGLGLLVELMPWIAFGAELAVLRWSFLSGAILFVAGGVFECLQNKICTFNDLTKGGAGAVMNLAGGLFFMMGALASWFDNTLSCNLFGVGSALYMVSSSIQIVMWKDEQFGLTFLAVLNNLESPGKLANLVNNPNTKDGDDAHASFSTLGAFFIHVYCICGAMSMYNFNIEVKRATEVNTWRSIQFALNEFLPCLFAHMMIALTSAVMRTPKLAPFRQLYRGARWTCLLLMFNSMCTLCEFLIYQIRS
mmetsp:Transcript_33205/g.94420  ORF Transcript_33205/g.94420 Transcript_33205/m.94420 type:complete len:468 (-) Transcript_33205:187-1590(-)